MLKHAILALCIAMPAGADAMRETPYYAAVSICSVDESGWTSCGEPYVDPRPWRVLADCLIQIEQTDRRLRTIGDRIGVGACSSERPEGVE